jgi:phosphoribosylanthranilate isomerase
MIVKICGIQNLATALAVEKCGAELMGFVFAPSRRSIDPAAAAKIGQRVHSIKKVGVFVNEEIAVVNAISSRCDLDYVQLHGSESPDYCKFIHRPVIKAFPFSDTFSADMVNVYPVELILIDSWDKGLAGGTGKKFDWEKASSLLNKIEKPFLLAGGLTCENIKEAVDKLNPYGLDVSGGVEENGIKSILKIEAFVKEARKAERRMV